MSRTDKDLPYHIRARISEFVEHDHSTGQCVVGTREEELHLYQLMRNHRPHCPRQVYIVDCVHNYEREQYQKIVNTARAAQKSYFPSLPGESEPVSVSRSVSADAITRMLDAGYFPNCDQAKTHSVDVREVDLGLLPGEEIPVRTLGLFGRYRSSQLPALLRPRYDADIACEYCDSHPLITCVKKPVNYYRNYNYCSCCTDDPDERYSSRRQTRDEMSNLIKEYNTFGELERY